MSRLLRPARWAWAPGACLAAGTILSSAAGSLLVQYAIEGTTEGPWRISLLIAATLTGGALVWWAAQLNTRRSAKAGWFLHCTASTARYQQHRFETEDRAYRQWASRQAPQPHVLPRLQIAVDQIGGVLRYLEAAERDLEVAFGMSPDVSQQVHLLANGAHEANFWLGWHLSSKFRRSRPLTTLSLVADQPAAPGTDSHMALKNVTAADEAAPGYHVIELEVTRRWPTPGLESTVHSRPTVSLACLSDSTWTTCGCKQPHHNAIIAIDPESGARHQAESSQLASEPAASGQAADLVVKSSRMARGIEDIAPQIGADSVLWITCDGIESSVAAYTAFLQAVTQAIHQHTSGSGKRYLAFTGPVMLATLLGVHLANQGHWSYLAYDSARYAEVRNPRAPTARQ